MGKGKRQLSGNLKRKLLIDTPAENETFSRGFYQVEEDSLYVPFYPGGKFFSYLDSPQMTMDIDNRGRLLFIKLLVSRQEWKIVEEFSPPQATASADIHFIDFRERLSTATMECNQNKSSLHLCFDNQIDITSYKLSDDIIVDISANNCLAGLWIKTIVEDRAAREMSAWRKSMNNGDS